MNQQSRSLHGQDNTSGSRRQTVRTGLQRATHAAHVRINQHPLLSGLTRPGYPLDRYKTLLAAYYHIYTGIEKGIDDFLTDAGSPLFNYHDRRKLPWLTADLGYFGVDAESPVFRPLRPIKAPPVEGTGALIGVLYAVEGATLGGQIISRHLHDTLALTANAGARFFNGYGDSSATQKYWQEFGEFADSIGDTPEQQRRAEASALCIFELIEEQLNDYHARFGC